MLAHSDKLVQAASYNSQHDDAGSRRKAWAVRSRVVDWIFRRWMIIGRHESTPYRTAERTKLRSLHTIRVSAAIFLVLYTIAVKSQTPGRSGEQSSVGFDRNEYPGDVHLAQLRKTFSFSGYWLNPPPGATQNTWVGKRAPLREAGFGFLVLFNGRLDAELKKAPDPGEPGRSDAETAVAVARREGFPPKTIIFLDQEEGSRMLPEQKAYIYAWVDSVNAAGFRAGIYCSGIEVSDDGARVITAEDLRQNAADRQITYWVSNDTCPPSPGCTVPGKAPRAAESGIAFAEVWQYAQSPKRRDVAHGCPKNYARDLNCYPPDLEKDKLFVDLDFATEADPSAGR